MGMNQIGIVKEVMGKGNRKREDSSWETIVKKKKWDRLIAGGGCGASESSSCFNRTGWGYTKVRKDSVERMRLNV